MAAPTASEGGKVFLVTGCSSGLGLSIVRVLLQQSKHKVIATSRNPAGTPELVQEVESGGGSWLPLDTIHPDAESQLHKAITLHGCIDVLINNAAIGFLGPFELQSMEAARLNIDTNFLGPIRLIHEVLPGMRERKSGTIVNISSAGVYFNAPGLSLYAASKSALDTFTATLAAEVACHGIKVMAAIPGNMLTPMVLSDKSKASMSPLTEAYKDTPVTATYGMFAEIEKYATIDVDKAAQRIVEATLGTGILKDRCQNLVRLPIGVETNTAMARWGSDFIESVGQYEDVGSSVQLTATS